MDSRTIIRMLKEDGWYEVNCAGSHHQFRHPVKKGKVTVVAPKKDYALKTLEMMEKQSGLKFR